MATNEQEEIIILRMGEQKKKISNFIVCGPIEEALVKTIEMSAEISNNCIF